jgi:cell division protein FtsB
MNLDDLASTDGVGRDVLCERIRLLVQRVRNLQDDTAAYTKAIAVLSTSNAQLVENMSSTQRRCTELLEQARSSKKDGAPDLR